MRTALVQPLERRLCRSAIPSAIVQPDWHTPGEQELVVVGTDGDDTISFVHPSPDSNKVGVMVNGSLVDIKRNGVSVGTSVRVKGRLVAYGLGGFEDIRVAADVSNEAWLYGDEGRSNLTLGPGGGVAIGGPSDDFIFGSQRTDLLIGGGALDRIRGNEGKDILIGGSTVYDDRSDLSQHESAIADPCGVAEDGHHLPPSRGPPGERWGRERPVPAQRHNGVQ